MFRIRRAINISPGIDETLFVYEIHLVYEIQVALGRISCLPVIARNTNHEIVIGFRETMTLIRSGLRPSPSPHGTPGGYPELEIQA